MTSSSSDTTSSSVTGASPSANKLAISLVAADPSTIKKGLLWQQRDRFFSRWKERYFVLTKDYLACFKKGSKVAMSEMGSFMYKLNLVEVEGLNWADKKRDGVIAIRVGTEGQLLLWSNSGLDEWMFALRESVNRSKGRREALRKSQTLLPSMTGGAIWNRQKLTSLHYTLSDSPVGARNTTSRLQRATSADFSTCDDPNRQLRSTIHHNPTPVLNRRFQRISVLTNIDLSFESASGERRSLASNNDDQHTPLQRTGLPRLAPQCGGSRANANVCNQIGNLSANSSLQSLASLGRTNTCAISNQLNKPSPRSLQVSPALAQRSLYAQHILSSPEIIGVNTTDSRHHQNAKSALKTATSEFSFIRPDSPLTLPHNTRYSSANQKKPQYYRSQSCIESQHQKQSQKIVANTANCVNRSSSSSTKLALEKMAHQSARPSSIYGQPSFADKPYATNKGNQNNYYCPSDAVPSHDRNLAFSGNGHTTTTFNKIEARDTKSMPKRQLRLYKQSKSDTVFATTNRPHSLLTSNAPQIQAMESINSDKLINKHKMQSKHIFAVR